MAVHMREVLVRPNLVPRALPLKNGWEKPWGRGWVRPWIGVLVSFALQASSVCLITRIHFVTICVIFSLFEFGSSPEGSFYLLMGLISAPFKNNSFNRL